MPWLRAANLDELRQIAENPETARGYMRRAALLDSLRDRKNAGRTARNALIKVGVFWRDLLRRFVLAALDPAAGFLGFERNCDIAIGDAAAKLRRPCGAGLTREVSVRARDRGTAAPPRNAGTTVPLGCHELFGFAS